MAKPVLVLDTNVLVSALRSTLGASYRLVQLVGEDRFEVGLTTPLVFEYEAVCKRLVGLVPITETDIEVLVNFMCTVGRRSTVRFRLRPAVADPDDEMVLEAAVASGSDWIVTYNVADFLPGAGRYGVEVITPAEALHRLGEKK